MSLFSSKPQGQANSQPSMFGSSQQGQPSFPAANATTNTQNSTLGTSAPTVSTGATSFAPSFGKNGASASGLPAQIAPDASSNRILKDLLDSAHNLPKLQHANIAPINLTLNELNKETRELRKKDSAPGNLTKAHYMLSKSGVNASDFEAELSSLPIRNNDEQGLEISGRNYGRSVRIDNSREDIDDFLLAKKEETIMNAIEQSLGSASRDFDKFINSSVTIDWKVRKDHLKKQLGIPVRTKITSEELAKSFKWNKVLPGTSRILTPLATSKTATNSTRQVGRDKFEGNARVVYALNESRLENKAYALCSNFEQLCKSSADSKSRQMGEIWRILADLTSEKSAKVSQEQLFCSAYQQATPGKQLKKQIVQNSKSALEQQFFNYMDEIYTKDDKKPSEFQPATNINKVSFFIHKVITKNNDSKLMEKTLNYNGVPIWALVYYLMRSGLYAEAVELTQSNAEVFNKFDSNFPAYVSNFVSQGCLGLSSEMHERISSDFNQTFQYINEDSASFDPYKYAVYKVIGKCDLVKRTLPGALNLSIEDWLWFHLSIINEFGSTDASDLLYENYTLENLQRKVVSSGPARFNASSNHPVYAKTLVMLGLYELAVQYVYESINECDAVHLAIGLSYYGLLKSTKTNTDELIIVDAEDAFQINLSRLLGSYTRTFKISDPKVAAQYLILICLAKGGHSSEETAKCHEALRELISVSREFGLLLGELQPETANKIPGILERQRALINLPEVNAFQSKITKFSAQRCEDEGRAFDALKLYQLCQEYDTVVSLLNKLLSEQLLMTDLSKPVLTGETFRTPEGEIQPVETSDNNVILLSRKLRGIFASNSFISGKISREETEIMDYLLRMVEIRQKFAKKDWEATLDSLHDSGLVPYIEHDDFSVVSSLANKLNNYDERLTKIIPSALVMMLMSILGKDGDRFTKLYGPSRTESVHLGASQTVAKNCMLFASMLQYKMPRETFDLLVSMEAQIQAQTEMRR